MKKQTFMLPIRKTLLEQINLTFNKKLSESFKRKANAQKNKQWISELFEATERNEQTNRENMFTKKLERRIDILEKQNDQLTCFIDFLIENLPELINNIIINKTQTSRIRKSKIENESDINGLEVHCCKKGNSPNPTPREAEVLDLLVRGLCAKEIAHKLFISETTVITHKKNLKEKYNARNTVELISKAYKSLTKNEEDS